jgi:hypothetical protein
MQRKETINNTDVNKIVDAVYAVGEPEVSEEYSKCDEDIVSFDRATDLMNYINEAVSKNEKFLYFAVYYPGAKGFVEKEKIKLVPKACSGHTFRFRIKGWGVIYFQLDYQKEPNVKCRFAVNTEKRANNWADTYPKLKSPSLWDWKLVEKHARRLIHQLKKYGQ